MRTFLAPAALILAMLAVAIVFCLDPSIDLSVASFFYRGGNTFVGQSPLGEAVRRAAYWFPTLLLLGNAVLYGLGRWGPTGWWAPSGRALLFLAVSFALGPGLLVNTMLKDHSHRPRPYQTIEFGGDEVFRPIFAFDGACARNCSFVSGEGAAAAWTVAPALLLPPPIRVVALGAALVFATGVAALRMAFGGHYMSDSLFAALLTWFVVWAVWRALLLTRLPPPLPIAVDRARRHPG